MNELNIAAAQMDKARDYLSERGFSAATLTALRRRLDLSDDGRRQDMVKFDLSTYSWTAYTVLGNTRPWESTEQFDDPIGAYLHAELSDWGRS